jgi:hypothetical protein
MEDNMSLYTLLRAAEDMGVQPRKAVTMRLHYLMPQIKELRKEVTTAKKRVAKAFTPRGRTKHEVSLAIAMSDLEPLEREAQALLDFINGKVKVTVKTGAITPEMIARAKAIPITQLLGQQSKGGVVHCPFHKDKDPSASVRNNFLICFGGCTPKDGRKGWDTISLLMERDGLTFREAVLALLQ